MTYFVPNGERKSIQPLNMVALIRQIVRPLLCSLPLMSQTFILT